MRERMDFVPDGLWLVGCNGMGKAYYSEAVERHGKREQVSLGKGGTPHADS